MGRLVKAKGPVTPQSEAGFAWAMSTNRRYPSDAASCSRALPPSAQDRGTQSRQWSKAPTTLSLGGPSRQEESLHPESPGGNTGLLRKKRRAGAWSRRQPSTGQSDIACPQRRGDTSEGWDCRSASNPADPFAPTRKPPSSRSELRAERSGLPAHSRRRSQEGIAQAGSRCLTLAISAQGSPPSRARRTGTVSTLKAAGSSVSDSSSQLIGVATGAPGRERVE